MASFGEDPKEEVITMERILLKTIKFDLQVDHPYRFLIEYAKCLKGVPIAPLSSTKEEVVQKAWNFINDSLETTLCLQWEPEIIAVAMMYLACKISKYDIIDWKGRIPEHQKWWDMFVKDMNKNILDDICHQVSTQEFINFSRKKKFLINIVQVLDLYQMSKIKVEVPDSPPQLPPSKTYIVKESPPQRKTKLQQSPNVNPMNKIVVNHIPVKVIFFPCDLFKM
jgi:cyclin K